MSYLEELLPEFRKGAKIRCSDWDKERFIYYNGYVIWDENHYPIFKEVSDWTDVLLSDNWELYQDPEPDWQYIIDNKCLCWFWDNNFNWAVCGTLGKIEKNAEYGFIMFDDSGNRSAYSNCRPVRKNEVTFYEEKNNE